MENRYISAIKRLNKGLDRVARAYNKPKLYFWLDALFASIGYGVTPNQYMAWHFYGYSALERKRFYTHRHTKKIEKQLNDPKYADIFWDKARFNAYFKEFVKRDWLDCRHASIEEINQFLNSHTSILLKPIALSSGKGIQVYRQETAAELKQKGFLLEEKIIQHPLLSSFNSSSVNSVRIYTLLDRKNISHVLSATLRVGNGGVVDNYHAGGIACPIDIETGIIYRLASNLFGEEFICHPTTHIQLVGQKIPNWNKLKEFVFAACHKIVQARLIAWDIAVLENGFELIEGNYQGDPGMLQSPSKKGLYVEIKKYM